MAEKQGSGKPKSPPATKTTGRKPPRRPTNARQVNAQRLALLNQAQRQAAVQRQAEAGGGSSVDVGAAIERRRGLGSRLPGDLQAQLESGLEADMSDVRVHTDTAADQLAQTVQAKAFTTGSDIFFRSGQYNPGSESGKHLVAHEATHVRQQRQGPVSGTATNLGVSISDPADTFEQEAETSADTFIQRMRDNALVPGAPPPDGGGDNGGPPAVQRRPAGRPLPPGVIQRCPECGRPHCNCHQLDDGAPAQAPVQRQPDGAIGVIDIAEDGQELLASLQLQPEPGVSSGNRIIQREEPDSETATDDTADTGPDPDLVAAELALFPLAEGVPYEVQGNIIVVRRQWVADTDSGADFSQAEIKAPKSIVILLKELKDKGPLSYVDASLIDKAAEAIALGGPWLEPYTWKPFILALSVRASLGSPPDAPDVEWHRIGDSFTLTIRREFIDANKDTPENVAMRVIKELEARTTLTTRSEYHDSFKAAMVKDLENTPEGLQTAIITPGQSFFKTLFGAEVWKQYLLEHPAEEGSGGKGGSGPPAPSWAKELRKQVMEMVTQERAKPEPPADLPDRLTIWYRDKDQHWFMNVLVHFDSTGNKRAHESLKLSQSESATELFARVRNAAAKARKKGPKAEKGGSGGEEPKPGGPVAPPWAIKLLDQIKKIFDGLREKEPSASDIPSGFDLGQGEKRKPPPTDPAEAVQETESADDALIVLLVIEVDIDLGGGDSKTIAGTLGWPLSEGINAEDLVAPIRSATQGIRLQEYDPGERPPPAPGQKSPTDPSAIAELNAYPSYIQAPNMPEGDTTITGGEIEFSMELKYSALHGSNQGGEMISAVHNAMRTVYYEWRLYDVSEVKNPDLKGDETQDWPTRSQWLRNKFVYSDEFKSAPLERVDSLDTTLSQLTGLDDLKQSAYQLTKEETYKFPSTPSEYLVFCRAMQSRDEDEPQRAPSVAYYPVRTLSGYTIASKPVNAIPDRIAEIHSDLANPDLPAKERKALSEELAELEKQEGQLLPERTKDRLAQATQSLEDLDRLEDLLPGLQDYDYDQRLMRLPKELHNLYFMLEVYGVTIDELRSQFEMQKKQLKDLQGRIGIYDDMFKVGSPYQYRPEAALASEKTGQVHPFIFMLGEAKGSEDGDWKFHLIDVTAEQTRGVYTGTSSKSGTEGIDQAIHRAFVAFGEEAKYGEGVIAVRIPPRSSPLSHQPNIEKSYMSSPGPWQTVKLWLGYLAAAAGIAALILGTIATGGALAVAATVLGTFSGVVGAALAIDNIRQRVNDRRFAWDAEMVLDIISIVGGVVSIVGIARLGAGLTRLRYSPRWIRGLARTDEILYIYGAAEMAGTVIVTPIKVLEDLKRIEDSDMSDEQKAAMKAQIILGAVQQGVMIIAGAYQTVKGPNPFKHNEYKSMVERGWIDPKTMTFTDKAPPQVTGAKVTTPGQTGDNDGGSTSGQGGETVQGGDTSQSGDSGGTTTRPGQEDSTTGQGGDEGDVIVDVEQGSSEDNAIPVPGTEETLPAPDQNAVQDGAAGAARDGDGDTGSSGGGDTTTGRDTGDGDSGTPPLDSDVDVEVPGAGRQPDHEPDGGDIRPDDLPDQSAVDRPVGQDGGAPRVDEPQSTVDPSSPEVAKAQDTISETGDFKKIRQKAKEGDGHMDPDVLEAARQKTIANAEAPVRAEVEANHDVSLSFDNMGSPGFNSDIDKTANARSPHRVQLEAEVAAGRMKPEDVGGQLSQQEIQSEVQASMDAVKGMYDRLGDPDKTLDANFYTELRENDIMRFASPEERSKIVLDDQSVVSLAELHRGMSSKDWKQYKNDQVERLKAAGLDDRVAPMQEHFTNAEKLAAEVEGADINDLYQQLGKAMAEGRPVGEQRDIMAKIKLKEPDAYGTRAAVEDVVGSQQTGATHAREMQGLSEKVGSGELTMSQAQQVMDADMEASFKAFMDRRGGHPEGSPEHLHWLAQSAEASMGKLHGHTQASGNSYKQVRDAAKYFGRTAYAGREAGLDTPGLSRDVARVVLAKYAPPDQVEARTLDALRIWAQNNGHENLVNRPSKLRDAFVEAMYGRGKDVSIETRAAAEHSRPGAWESDDWDMPDMSGTPGAGTPGAGGAGAPKDTGPTVPKDTGDAAAADTGAGTKATPAGDETTPTVAPDDVHDASAVPDGTPARVEGPEPSGDKPKMVTRINEDHTVSIVKLEDGTYVIKMCSNNCPQLRQSLLEAMAEVQNNPNASPDVKEAWVKVFRDWMSDVSRLEIDLNANPNNPDHQRRLGELGTDIFDQVGRMRQSLEHLAATTTTPPLGDATPVGVTQPDTGTVLAQGTDRAVAEHAYLSSARIAAGEDIKVGFFRRVREDGTVEYIVVQGTQDWVAAPGEGWTPVAEYTPGAADEPGLHNPAPQDMLSAMFDFQTQGGTEPITRTIHSETPDGEIVAVQFGYDPNGPDGRQYFVQVPGEERRYFRDIIPDSAQAAVAEASTGGTPQEQLQETMEIFRGLDPDESYAGWWARQFEHMGGSSAPAASTPASAALINPNAGTMLPADAQIINVTPATAPDVVPPPPQVLQFPDGDLVWRDGVDGPVRHSSEIRSGIGRRHYERAFYAAGAFGRPHGPRYERAHTLGQGTGFESPYMILDAPRYVNQDLQNQGIEKFLRDLATNMPADTRYQVNTYTDPIWVDGLPTRRLGEINYQVDVIVNGVAHPFLEYNINVSGTQEHPHIQADPIVFADNPVAQAHRGRVALPDILAQDVNLRL